MELVVRNGLTSPAAGEVELVERKGLGHPDTICDAIAEAVCVRLCRHYRETFGTILHHNVDKVLLCGGAARPAFGGGAVLEPMEIVLAGRVTTEFRGIRIPADEIAVEACRAELTRILPGLDRGASVRIVPRFRPGSADLAVLLDRARANDTSCGVGFAPPTALERVVLAAERALNDPATKRAHRELGTDVKIMGVRRGSRIALTVACAIVDRHVPDLAAYVRATATARSIVLEAAARETALDVEAAVNCADDLDRGDLYLTVTGTSAEGGDDGEAGRGNRVSGLITPYRAMTMEAAAGKNPVSHVGKLYGVAAHRIAASIAAGVAGVADATCLLVSRIGQPVSDPALADVRLALTPGSTLAGARETAEAIARTEVTHLDALRETILDQRVTLF